ncbi:MAG: hypothetical protein REJ50_25015, partial [Bordetella sp.]|nr:hypothetical protein [Bordetella sp.]
MPAPTSGIRRPQATRSLDGNSRRHFIATLASAAGVASLQLQPAFGQTATPRRGGTLIVGLSGEPSVFDPNRQFSYETYRIDKHIYESLVAENLS